MVEVRIEFRQNFWVAGVFWKTVKEYGEGEFLRHLHIWICLIPCFPIHIIILLSDEE